MTKDKKVGISVNQLRKDLEIMGWGKKEILAITFAILNCNIIEADEKEEN